jgi:phosphate transport system substrate-binding protein
MFGKNSKHARSGEAHGLGVGFKLGVAAFGAFTGMLAAGASFATEMTGAGSTFVYPILSKWAADYSLTTRDHLTYQSIGSGAGIAQIKAGTVDFGATDKPLSSAELVEAGLGQFPLVIGGVVPIVNISGVRPGELRFSGTLLAKIYLGKITRWQDPAITALNPDASLPDAEITVVHRSDASGTTFNWVNFLSKVSNEWKEKIGEGTTVAWPVGVGGKGNEGIAAYVNRIPNSIAYVEYTYSAQNRMTYGLVQNRAGKFVTPDSKGFQAAAATADWKHSKDFFLVMTDASGPNAYPVTATVFILMPKRAKDAEHSKAALKFFRWAIEHGQAAADTLNYVSIPGELVTQIEGYWTANFPL